MVGIAVPTMVMSKATKKIERAKATMETIKRKPWVYGSPSSDPTSELFLLTTARDLNMVLGRVGCFITISAASYGKCNSNQPDIDFRRFLDLKGKLLAKLSISGQPLAK